MFLSSQKYQTTSDPLHGNNQKYIQANNFKIQNVIPPCHQKSRECLNYTSLVSVKRRRSSLSAGLRFDKVASCIQTNIDAWISERDNVKLYVFVCTHEKDSREETHPETEALRVTKWGHHHFNIQQSLQSSLIYIEFHIP